MKRFLLFMSFLLVFSTAFAQKENKIWYFGDHAGLDFNYDPPRALTNSSMYAEEGCGVVCDTAGDLLFYTNGEKIWNKNHELMPIMINGFLYGNSSSCQKGTVVSHPGDPTLCYIFTTGAHEGAGVEGFCYTIVDMALDDGLGDVSSTEQNKLIENSSEKIAVAEHSNGVDRWVVTHDVVNKNITAFPITKDGIGEPVETYEEIGDSTDILYRTGYMTFSRDYSKLALALYYDNLLVIYDFDQSTGKVSNPIILGTSGSNYRFAYGIEFSPDGSKLYASRMGQKPSEIYQFDISSGNAEEIENSKQIIATNNSNDSVFYYSALMLGPDDKIYVASHENGYLHRIDSPNLAGDACGFVENAVYLEGKLSCKGLPSRAMAATIGDTSGTTDPVDTSDVEGLNPEFVMNCTPTACYDAGKLIKIPYALYLSEDILNSGDMSGDMTAILNYNRFLIYPNDSKIISTSYNEDDTYAVLTDNISNHIQYVYSNSFSAYTGLGKTDYTDIILKSLIINGIEYDVDTLDVENGCICINICEKGGDRLVNPETQKTYLKALPNPAADVINIEYELIEKGRSEVYLVDVLGRRVCTVNEEYSENTGLRQLQFATRDIHSGLYNLVLQTPTIKKTVLLQVVK